MKTNQIIVLALTACGAVLMGVALAANDAAPPPAPPASGAMSAAGAPPGPPPEAVAACKGKTEGASVSFTGRGGETLTGTCQAFSGVLAARPLRAWAAPAGGRHRHRVEAADRLGETPRLDGSTLINLND